MKIVCIFTLVLLYFKCVKATKGQELENWNGLIQDICAINLDVESRKTARKSLKLGVLYNKKRSGELSMKLKDIVTSFQAEFDFSIDNLRCVYKLSEFEPKIGDNEQLLEIVNEFEIFEHKSNNLSYNYNMLNKSLMEINKVSKSIYDIIENDDRLSNAIILDKETVLYKSGRESETDLDQSDTSEMKYNDKDYYEKTGCKRSELCGKVKLLNSEINKYNKILREKKINIESWQDYVQQMNALNEKLLDFIEFCIINYRSVRDEIEKRKDEAKFDDTIGQLYSSLDFLTKKGVVKKEKEEKKCKEDEEENGELVSDEYKEESGVETGRNLKENGFYTNKLYIIFSVVLISNYLIN
uniref:Uncharacterized protein n=1 Tax=Theileria annulata TaxID=5874 RepID=A0A3B0N3X9_THEAN